MVMVAMAAKSVALPAVRGVMSDFWRDRSSSYKSDFWCIMHCCSTCCCTCKKSVLSLISMQVLLTFAALPPTCRGTPVGRISSARARESIVRRRAGEKETTIKWTHSRHAEPPCKKCCMITANRRRTRRASAARSATRRKKPPPRPPERWTCARLSSAVAAATERLN